MIFPSNFARHDVYRLPSTERAAAAAAIGLARFEEFLESVAGVGATAPGRLVRNYLLDLFRTGHFSIVSPATGATLRSGSSLLLVDKSVLFSFPDEPDIMIGIGDVSQGYPICALVVVEPPLLVPVIDSPWGFAERHLAWAAQAIRDTGWSIAPTVAPMTVVTGDLNFAHVAWNQLSAFHDLTPGELPPGLRLLATQQPLGPLRDILPQLASCTVEPLPDTALQARNRPGLLFVPVGASRMTAALVEHIRHYCLGRMSEEARALDAALARAGSVLWVSVRTRNRTAINQHELLTELANAYLAAVPDGSIVIDGHSYPDDLADYPDYHRTEAEAVLSGDRAAAGALQADLSARWPGRVYLAVGLNIIDTLALGRRAAVYFCHHGTVQHKVGWFNRTSGVVHCNRTILEQSPAAWVAAQSEVAVPPVYLSPELVADAPVEDAGEYGEFAGLLRHDNYVVRDIPSAVATVMRLVESSGLLPAPPLRPGREPASPPTLRGRLAKCLAWIARPR